MLRRILSKICYERSSWITSVGVSLQYSTPRDKSWEGSCFSCRQVCAGQLIPGSCVGSVIPVLKSNLILHIFLLREG